MATAPAERLEAKSATTLASGLKQATSGLTQAVMNAMRSTPVKLLWTIIILPRFVMKVYESTDIVEEYKREAAKSGKPVRVSDLFWNDFCYKYHRFWDGIVDFRKTQTHIGAEKITCEIHFEWISVEVQLPVKTRSPSVVDEDHAAEQFVISSPRPEWFTISTPCDLSDSQERSRVRSPRTVAF